MQKAKALGGELVVGLESDARVRQLKGEGRPVNDIKTRIANLEKWGIADKVIELAQDFDNPKVREKFIANLRPRYLAVSSHSDHQDKKRELVEKYGGELVVVHKHNPEFSSSKLLGKNQKH